MEYFLGHLIQGEAGSWHHQTAQMISEKFGTWALHERIPPHITIFYPFTENLEPVREILRFQTENSATLGDFSISDYDRFGDRVIFAKIDTSDVITKTVEKLRKQLSQIPGMPPMDFPHWHPHATLANKLPPDQIDAIWEYVQTLPKPNFTFPFDNITIFRYEEPKWHVHESFWFRK